MTYEFLIQYWWFIVSLLGALLVMMMFVQGGQMLLRSLGKTEQEQTLIVNALGHKWEITFTTLVTFGGALFAAFPLFYSTCFGGAYALWLLILFSFILQAVSYHFRSKAGNLFGAKTYEAFLQANGVMGTVLLGVVVGTFFTGAAFSVEKGNIARLGGALSISGWHSPWHGLEAIINPLNLSLGFTILWLARVLALQYFIRYVDNENITGRARKLLPSSALGFALFFALTAVLILSRDGAAVYAPNNLVYMQSIKYLRNFLAMPALLAMLLCGIGLLVFSVVRTLQKKDFQSGFWWAGAGAVLVVLSLLLNVGYNDTAFYYSTYRLQQSLTIYNSASSKFTLQVMSVVSLIIPFVLAYIAYVWRAMGRKKISVEELEKEEHAY